MKRLIQSTLLLGLVAALAQPALAQENPMEDPRAVDLFQRSEKAIQELQARNYDRSVEMYEKIIADTEAYTWLPDEVRDEQIRISTYNIACAYALQGKTEPALDWFEKAVKKGFDDLDHIDQDTDLDSIRDQPRFKKIIAENITGESKDPLAAAKAEIVASLTKKGEALFPFDFDLTTIQGGKVKLSALKGKVVLVDVWGTWCPPCRAEIPHLKEILAKHQARGFEIVGLNWERVPADKAEAHVKKFLDENGIKYDCALAPRELIDSIPDFQGFPTMLMVGRDGHVRLKKVGYTDGPILEAAIDALLNEGAPPAPKDEAPPLY